MISLKYGISLYLRFCINELRSGLKIENRPTHEMIWLKCGIDLYSENLIKEWVLFEQYEIDVYTEYFNIIRFMGSTYTLGMCNASTKARNAYYSHSH